MFSEPSLRVGNLHFRMRWTTGHYCQDLTRQMSKHCTTTTSASYQRIKLQIRLRLGGGALNKHLSPSTPHYVKSLDKTDVIAPPPKRTCLSRPHPLIQPFVLTPTILGRFNLWLITHWVITVTLYCDFGDQLKHPCRQLIDFTARHKLTFYGSAKSEEI